MDVLFGKGMIAISEDKGKEYTNAVCDKSKVLSNNLALVQTEKQSNGASIKEVFDTACSVDELNSKITDVRSMIINKPDFSYLSVENLIQDLLHGIKNTGNFNNKAIELKTLAVILIGMIANELKSKIKEAKGNTWTEFAKKTFGELVAIRTLEQYMVVAKFNDSHLYAFLGIKILYKLGKAAQKKDSTLQNIKPFLESKNISGDFDNSDFKATEEKKEEIKNIFKKPTIDNVKLILRKIKAVRRTLKAVSELSGPELRTAKHKDLYAIKTLAVDLAESLNQILPPVATQLQLPIFSNPDISEG